MNIEEMNQVIKWMQEGTLQYKIGQDRWTDYSEDSPSVWYPKDDFNNYRRKPTHTLRPWKPKEVPVGAIIRYKLNMTEYNHLPAVIIDVEQDVLVFGRSVKLSFIGAHNYCEHSLDHGRTWHPCGVYET